MKGKHTVVRPGVTYKDRPVMDRLVLVAETELDRRLLAQFYLSLRKTGVATLKLMRRNSG